jgi:nucleotide-binding universal stress UspA family protein
VAGRIVVGVDGSSHGRHALRFALSEAALRGAGVDVVSSWAVPPLAATGVGLVPAFDLLRAELGDSARQVVAGELADAADAAAGLEIEQHVSQGDAAGVLVEAAAGADLLVVGSRGRGGVTGTVLGSVSRACLQHAPCPVAVVHDAGPTERSRIVVGVDGSPGAGAAQEWAYAEAELRDVGVFAVCAYDEPWGIATAGMSSAAAVAEVRTALAVEAGEVLEAAYAAAPDSVGVTSEAIRSAAGPALVSAADGSALLVVGSRGRGGFTSLLLGSVSQYCATHARGVVVVVRARAS